MFRPSVLALVLLATPALADITAVYQVQHGAAKMTIEVADDGDVRSDMNARGGSYFLRTGSQDYTIIATPSGPVADRQADLIAATVAVALERDPHLKERMRAMPRQLAGRQFFVEGGTVSINGRPGSAYILNPTPPSTESGTIAVISHDSSLAPLGPALAQQFAGSEQAMVATAGYLPPELDQLNRILKSGGPLAFAGMALTEVSHVPIPAARFQLPGPPESLGQIEKRLRAATPKRPSRSF